MRNQKERTVFYVQQNQVGNWVDLYCLDSKAEAKEWIAKNNIEDTQILEVQSSTRHPEMVNKRFDNPSMVVEQESEESIESVYELQVQDELCKNGWRVCSGKNNPYMNRKDAESAGVFLEQEVNCVTRIRKVGIYS